jgi:D-alanyl-D-alanine carboxypeptidase/D-alanyl-D-alanine-endopeptidase (penicillin-binding protein 4)
MKNFMKKFILKILKIGFIAILLFLNSSFYSAKIETIFVPSLVIKEENPNAVSDIQNKINKIFEDYENHNFIYGLKIFSLDRNELIFSHNADKEFTPASNMKLITSAVALQLLSPEFRWKTDFYYNTENNLYIRGCGDPTWNDKYRSAKWNNLYNAIADSLTSKNVKTINNVFLETGNFNEFPVDYGWKEENLLATYSAKSSFFAFNDNTLGIKVEPGVKNNDPAIITIIPVNFGIEYVNNIKTSSMSRGNGIRIDYDYENNVLNLEGKIWLRAKPLYKTIATPNPESFAMDILKGKFEEFEIEVENEFMYRKMSDDLLANTSYKHIFSLVSPKLKKILYDINKRSNNFTANQLFLTIGNSQNNVWNTDKIVIDYLNYYNINTDLLKMYDGSGLSIHDRVSPDLLVDVLTHMRASDYFFDYCNSLAIAGKDGTLWNRFTSDITKGKIQAKTGYIIGVRSLSGYFVTQENELMAFSFIINKKGSTIPYFNEITDSLLTELILFSRKNITENIVELLDETIDLNTF